MKPPIRIPIADDHPVFRQGLRQTSESDPQLKVVAERVRILGGAHTTHSAPGQGTTIHIKIVCSHKRSDMML